MAYVGDEGGPAPQLRNMSRREGITVYPADIGGSGSVFTLKGLYSEAQGRRLCGAPWGLFAAHPG